MPPLLPEQRDADAAADAFERARALPPDAALPWLDRAWRMAPDDPTVMLALATCCLSLDVPRAVSLFRDIAARHDVREAWLGLAAACRRGGDPDGAADALGRALSGHAFDPGCAGMADAIARDAGAPGWCALSADGVAVGCAAGPGVIGHPVRPDAIGRVEGFAAADAGGLRGWAWHPGDPAADPSLTIAGPDGRAIAVVARDLDQIAAAGRLLARPRAFRVAADALAGLAMPLAVRGRDGRHLLGSPLDPGALTRTPAIPAAIRGAPAATIVPRPRPVSVVIPVHGGGRLVRDCLASVLAARGPERIVVVDDATEDAGLVAELHRLAAARRITLLTHQINRGFPASANAGIRASAGRDVVLLNSDTLVGPLWLDRLRAAAHAAADIGIVSPLSNDATILSYPGRDGGNPVPDAAETARLAARAWRANGPRVADVPTAVGFCMYLRHDCLTEVGLLREDVFAQGYGEENDFCLRARHLGWRSVAALGAYVGHAGGGSFGPAREHLQARNMGVLETLHPGYGALIACHVAADPLAAARRRMDRLRFAAGARAGSLILITHDEAGGVEQVVAAQCESVAARGLRPIVLRPARAAGGARVVVVQDGVGRATPNLRFAMPAELGALARLLRATAPRRIAVHHMMGHDWSLLGLIGRLGVRYDVHVHDHAWLCPRVTLVGAGRRYCGEPDAAACELCVADAGRVLDEDIAVADLRARSAALLAGADRVIVPSLDARARIVRHFGGRPAVVPHEDDRASTPARPRAPEPRLRVCVPGAIGTEKGYHVLLEAARDARVRALPLDYVLVGFSIDDRRLLDAGVFVSGRYRATDVTEMIVRSGACIGLIPSIWPETWCFALTEIWRAGLDAAVFDIGAPAERVRATGRGIVLPLGLSAAGLNDALLKHNDRSLPST